MEANKTPAKILKAFKAVMPIVRQFARKNQLAEVIQEDGELIPVTKVLADAEAAIAAPPRNCDVGTARQQERRHKEEVCLKSACPKHEGFVSKACKGCFAMWAQMPYGDKGI